MPVPMALVPSVLGGMICSNSQYRVRFAIAPLPTMEENREQSESWPLEAERDNAIDRFDEWFRYAETIGQQRLQSFLQTSSILLAACALFLSTCDRELYSLPFSIIGIAFSFLWIYKGSRQSKFHRKLEQELERILKSSSHKEYFPGYHVLKMKSKDPLPLSIFCAMALQRRCCIDSNDSSDTTLGPIESWLSTRKFLWLVPGIFLFAYIACVIAAIFLARSGRGCQ
jgi:hypothetical protein